jgi:hypothetical protein
MMVNKQQHIEHQTSTKTHKKKNIKYLNYIDSFDNT